MQNEEPTAEAAVAVAWVDRAGTEDERLRRQLRAACASRHPGVRGLTKAFLLTLSTVRDGEEVDLATVAGWAGMSVRVAEKSMRRLVDLRAVDVEARETTRFVVRIRIDRLGPYQFDPGEILES